MERGIILSKKSIYKNKKCENEIMEVYDRQLARLGIDYEEKNINTRFGKTHVVITGQKMHHR